MDYYNFFMIEVVFL